MARKNRYLAQQIAVVANPLTFTAGTANTNANIDKLLELLSYEGTEQSIPRGFLDEMSPAARITLYRIITDLRAANV